MSDQHPTPRPASERQETIDLLASVRVDDEPIEPELAAAAARLGISAEEVEARAREFIELQARLREPQPSDDELAPRRRERAVASALEELDHRPPTTTERTRQLRPRSVAGVAAAALLLIGGVGLAVRTASNGDGADQLATAGADASEALAESTSGAQERGAAASEPSSDATGAPDDATSQFESAPTAAALELPDLGEVDDIEAALRRYEATGSTDPVPLDGNGGPGVAALELSACARALLAEGRLPAATAKVRGAAALLWLGPGGDAALLGRSDCENLSDRLP